MTPPGTGVDRDMWTLSETSWSRLVAQDANYACKAEWFDKNRFQIEGSLAVPKNLLFFCQGKW